MQHVVLTCEHGGYELPDAYSDVFKNQDEVLRSHRGWDPGALEMASYVADHLNLTLHYSTTTRLLIELNRSIDHPQLFSTFTSQLTNPEKGKLIQAYYLPYRKKVEDEIARAIDPVMHISFHSFVPVLNECVRELEIGLLFDPARPRERMGCEKLREFLTQELPNYRIVFNEPYQGIDDGFTTYLRTKFPDEHYAGIEIEINQALVDKHAWESLKEKLAASLATIL